MSTAKGRERRWRLFSTFPSGIFGDQDEGEMDGMQVTLDLANQ